MSRRRLYIFIPGIRHHSEGVGSWVDHAVGWVHRYTDHRAVAYEYESPALFRFVKQAGRVKDVAELCRRYAGDNIVLVGHSNAAAIICDVLRNTDVRVDSIHLIAGAADASFEKNGLNEAVDFGRVKNIHVYGSVNDSVLKRWAPLSRNLFGWAGLGYGDLGRVGPREVKLYVEPRLHKLWRNDYGHSTWLDREHFTDTMQLVTGHRFGPVEK